MAKSVKIKFAACIVLSLLALWLLSPTVWSLYNPEKADKLPGWMPKTAMKLGLDLQGGIHMVLGVDLDKVVLDQLATYGRSVEKALDKEGIKGVTTKVEPKNFELEVAVPSPGVKDKIADTLSKQFQVLEFVGDSGNLMIVRLTHDQEDYVRTHALDQSIETIRNRIDEFGVSEPVIARKGDNQILVQFPGAKEPERLKALIGQTAQLTFQIVHECTGRDQDCLVHQRADIETKIKEAETAGKYNRDTFKRFSDYRNKLNEDLKGKLPADTVIAFEKEHDVNVNNSTIYRPWLLSTKNVLSGEYIENAFVTLDRSESRMGAERPVVSFQMNAAGGPLMGALTTDFQGSYMAIVLDGVVRSAPVINNPITGGSGMITLGSGGFEEMNQEARDLSIVLRAGALPASIEVLEERIIGPSIGLDAISAGKSALIVTTLLIFAFMWIYYGVSGILGNFVVAINIALIFAILGMVGATLTLPGIAGIVLTISMAVDAIIIIYERMREEMRVGRPKRQVIELGFERAFSTILDSNVTTAIGAFVLLQYGTGSVRGFALTLLVGIVTNVIMSTFFAKTLFEVLMSGPKPLSLGLSSSELSSIHGETAKAKG